MTHPVAVIPARYGAQRFPGKPLALISGKPMVQQVVERCQEARCFDRIVVATEDERIQKAVEAFGGEAVMTSPACASGTDRVAEVASGVDCPGDTVFINVQGDEPALHPESLHLLAKVFEDPTVQMATLVRPLAEHERPNPNVVKVVLDESGHALYFSRADIPYARDAHVHIPRWAHLGIYGYRKATLLRLAALPATALEKTESLEQLRALANGVRIHCVMTEHGSQAVDTPEDVVLAEAALTKLPRPYPP